MILQGTIDQIVQELQVAWECGRCGEIYPDGVQAHLCHPGEDMTAAREVITHQTSGRLPLAA